MVPKGLCDRVPATAPRRSPRLGLEPGYRLLVQGDGYALNEACLQGLVLPHRLLVGFGERLLGGLGTLEPGFIKNDYADELFRDLAACSKSELPSPKAPLRGF